MSVLEDSRQAKATLPCGLEVEKSRPYLVAFENWQIPLAQSPLIVVYTKKHGTDLGR